MGFKNEIIGGQSALVRQAIKSPNYLMGALGWSINKDGSAEFNNVTVRGTFAGFDYEINSLGAFFYYGTPAAGNLALALAPQAGTDRFGNAFPDGVSLSVQGGVGNEIQLRPSKQAIFIYAG